MSAYSLPSSTPNYGMRRTDPVRGERTGSDSYIGRLLGGDLLFRLLERPFGLRRDVVDRLADRVGYPT